MKEDCLELLAKLDKCMTDPDFQIIVIMKFIRSMSPILEKVTENERPDK